MEQFLRITSHRLELIALYFHKIGTRVFLPLLAGVVCIDVILRYVFNAPLPWGSELSGLLLLLVVSLSLTYTWIEGRHVKLEIFYSRFPPKIKRIALIFTCLTGVLFFGALGIQAVREIPYMIATNESGQDLDIQLWPFNLVIATVAIQFVVSLIFTMIVGTKVKKKEGE